MGEKYNSEYPPYAGAAQGLTGPDWRDRIDCQRLRKDRIERLKTGMKNHELEAILCFDESNSRYATGTWGALHRYTLTGADGELIVFDCGDTEIQTRRNASWIRPENVRYSVIWHGGIGDIIDYMTPAAQETQRKKFVNQIKEALEDLGVHKGDPVGIDIASPKVMDALQDEGINVVPRGDQVMKEAREIKTKYEVESHRTAASVCEACFEVAKEEIKPGVRGHELTGKIYKKAFEVGAERVEAVGMYTGKDTWPNYKGVISNSIIRPGDIVYIDLILTVNGYHTCYYRTFSVGTPKQETRDAYERVYKWAYDAIKAVEPGATTKDLAEKWPDETEVWGLDSADEGAANNWAHGLGLDLYEPPMISRIWSLDHPYPLKPGMVFAIETQAGDGSGQGVRLEEMVHVTDSGAEVISRWPAEEMTIV